MRIGDQTSDWYPMDCGIHQGGYLSLVKYTAFIDSLISGFEDSDLCSSIYRIKASPLGYADDVAASTVSKRKMDAVMDRVYAHSCTWRYTFKADKSAVLVFGENIREHRIGAENRVFKMGTSRVKERLTYDHVGVKTCALGDTHVRTEEKVTKARKVLNMSTSMGIKRGGLNLETCNLIFWTVVVPVLCFGCEVWVLKQKDEDLLMAFQRYAARRVQRFHPRSINIACYICLGWMSLVNFIKAKKLIFLRTILAMNDYMPIKVILIERIREFVPDGTNRFDSPIVQILQLCHEFNLLNEVRDMWGGRMVSEAKWKEMVWGRVWSAENAAWQREIESNKYLDLLTLIASLPEYSVWWCISDSDRSYMRRCELMVRLICHTTLLKGDDCRYRRATHAAKMCILCETGGVENARHVIMQCPFHAEIRKTMCDEIDAILPGFGQMEVFNTLIGKPIVGVDAHTMYEIWKISCTYISHMYWTGIKKRDEYLRD